MDTTKTITHLSLCSGYSGIGLGLKRVLPNLREIAHVEIEAFAVANLVSKMEAEQIPSAPIFTNVKTFPYERFSGCVDILSGGFPCQPFSQAGARKGVEDPRHLYPYISRGIRECRPRIVFLENVEGIISSKTEDGESVLKYVLSDLESMGYRATAGIFSASEVGAPHQRKRVFIMGYSKHEGLQGHNEHSASEYRENEGSIVGTGSGCGTTEELGNSTSERCEGERLRIQQRQEGRLSGGTGEELPNTENIGCGGRSDRDLRGGRNIQEQETQERSDVRCEAEGCGGELAYADSGRRREDWQSTELRTEGTEQSSRDSGRINEREGHEELPNTDCQGLEGDIQDGHPEGWEESNGQLASSGRFPARPNECQYEWEQPRTKPRLGRATNGSTSRVDRLRLLGNGVVPATAARAFTVLIGRLID